MLQRSDISLLASKEALFCWYQSSLVLLPDPAVDHSLQMETRLCLKRAIVGWFRVYRPSQFVGKCVERTCARSTSTKIQALLCKADGVPLAICESRSSRLSLSISATCKILSANFLLIFPLTRTFFISLLPPVTDTYSLSVSWNNGTKLRSGVVYFWIR